MQYPDARKKFRWYWSFLSPGIIVIRRVMLAPDKCRGTNAMNCTNENDDDPTVQQVFNAMLDFENGAF
jgi:hypothetical protein